jgi:hypothetical protein
MLLKAVPEGPPSRHVVAGARSNSQWVRDVAPETGVLDRLRARALLRRSSTRAHFAATGHPQLGQAVACPAASVRSDEQTR